MLVLVINNTLDLYYKPITTLKNSLEYLYELLVMTKNNILSKVPSLLPQI